MPWVEDPTIGNVLGKLASDMGSAPGVALDNMQKVEAIKASRAAQLQNAADAARKQAIYDAHVKAANAFSATVPTAPPVSTFDAIGPVVGDVSNPADVAGIPTQELSYTKPEDAARFRTDRPFFDAYGRAVALDDPAKLPSAYARTQVGVGGVPDDQARKEQLQYLDTGKFDKPKPENYIAKDAAGNTVRVWASTDGGVTDTFGRKAKDFLPPGVQVVGAGSADLNAAPKSMFDTPGQTQNALVNAANDIASGRRLPSPEQTRVLAYGLRQQYPTIDKAMTDAVGNTMILKNYVEKNIPPELRPLVQHIADTLYPQPAATVPGPGDTAVVTQPQQVSTPEQRVSMGPLATQITSAAPASHEQQVLASATQRAAAASQQIEQMVFAGADPAKGQLPAKPYVPDWKAALLADRAGDNVLAAQIMNQLDPQAREYYSAAKAWVEPVLRIASGAAIRPEEYKDYMSMFIPNAGDSPTLVAQKLTRMREWQQTVGAASNANQATAMLAEKAQSRHDPEAVALAEKLRVRAQQAGSLDTNKNTLPEQPQTAQGPVIVAPAAAAPAAAAPAGLPAAADRVVGQKYPTPRGPMVWTKEGWMSP